MKLKKMLAVVTASAMVLGMMTGCGSSEAESAASSAAESASSAAAESAASSAAAESTASSAAAETAAVTTIEEGKLIMSTNAQFPPYELVADGDGYEGTGFEGIDVEVAYAIAQKLGLELVIDDMEFDSALSAVQQGKSDIAMAGITYTEERDEIMDFSDSYSNGVQVVIVKDGSSVATVDDLANCELIGTQRGTTGYIYCCDDYGDDHVAAYDNGATAVQALLNGQVDAVVIDSNPANEYVSANEGLSILDTEYTNEDYCIAVNEGNTQLLDAINGALGELRDDGTLQSIVDKYITAE